MLHGLLLQGLLFQFLGFGVKCGFGGRQPPKDTVWETAGVLGAAAPKDLVRAYDRGYRGRQAPRL